MKINYSALKPMDRIDCSGRSPLALVTRIVTAGLGNAWNHKVPVHTGIVVEWDGQLLCAEMGASGLEINPLSKYEGKGNRSIMNVSRHPLFMDAERARYAQRRIIEDYRRSEDGRKGVKYDYKGLLEFVFHRIKDNPKRYYCSEYFYALTFDLIRYPIEFSAKVSPYDLFRSDPATGFVRVQDWSLDK